MATIIGKNEELQRELGIVSKALELQTQAQKEEVEKLTEEKR